MRVVSVVGYRDAGKTTAVERLISELGKGRRVATVKSIHHEIEIDTPGKDTYRHREAGADTVVGLTPSITFKISAEGKTDGVGLESVLSDLHSDGFEYVVVEGFKDVSLPMILVGDIEAEAVGGEPIGRIPEDQDVDFADLLDAIRSVPSFE